MTHPLPVTQVVGRADILGAFAALTPRPPDVTPPPGGVVGLPQANPGPMERYELLGEIARGGMGVLLKARDAVLGREVVIKFLRDELRGCPASERRFLREARVNAQLQHPGIVPVYDVGRFPDGRPFLTMKYAYGRTLAALLADRPAGGGDPGRLVAVFEQVCQTIAYAHAKGVVHRDLKPLNVIASRFGQVRVLDWGLAKILPDTGADADDRTGRHQVPDADPGATAAGVVVGTPAYMPPEQARGEPADERCDVFALGAVLCEILTGRPPYVGVDLPDLWAQAKAADLSAAHEALAASGAPDGLLMLASWCLAPHPADRPKDAREVAAAVTAILAAGRPPVPPGPAARRGWVWPAAAAAAAGLAAGLAIFT